MSYRFFKNDACAYFPCHKGIDADAFNCLFCYCPLYTLGKSCGGVFRYDNPRGIKDCAGCALPHRRENYDYVVKRATEIVEQTKEL